MTRLSQSSPEVNLCGVAFEALNGCVIGFSEVSFFADETIRFRVYEDSDWGVPDFYINMKETTPEE